MNNSHFKINAANARSNFDYNLRLLRNSKSLTGKELSGLLDLHPGRIYQLEVGKGTVGLTDLFPIMGYFNISFEELCHGKIELQIKIKEVA
jgi:transcriptional regulator with XRE-family HTH domain